MVDAEKRLPLVDAIKDEQARNTTRRQGLIKQIQQELGDKRLIVYTANFHHPNSSMQHSDITPFEELLIDVGTTEDLYLMIDSPGGDPNIAEKLLMMCRARCKNFVAIVPNTAKSAATLICLGVDEILMGYLSELGPIDPQIRIFSAQGAWVFVPAQTIIDGFDDLAKGLKTTQNPTSELDPRAYLQLLSKLDPPTYDYAKKAQKLTDQFASAWLSKYMLKGNRQKVDNIVRELANATKWLSHGRAISYEMAKDLGLNVKMMERDGKLWKMIWELYVLSERHLQTTSRAKLFESETVSVHQ